MSKNRGQSLGRMKKRGRVDMLGKPLMKRPFNNSKRTRGRKKQEEIKIHYLDLMKRIRYIKSLTEVLKDNSVELTEDNWKEEVRKYDKHKLLFDDYEKHILFERVNNGA